MQIVLGFLLGLAADDVNVDPDTRLAPVRMRHYLEMGNLLLRTLQKGAVLKDDKIHIAVARGEVLRGCRTARVHDRRVRFLQWLRLTPDVAGMKVVALKIKFRVVGPGLLEELKPFGGIL